MSFQKNTPSFFSMRRAPLFGAVGLALSATTSLACAPVAATPRADIASPAVGVVRAISAGERCVAFQRGVNGDVADTRIAERWPYAAYGAETAAFAGTVAGARRTTLIRFDLDSLPQEGVVTKATLTLTRLSSGPSRVSVHRVTGNWSEGETTWDSFGAAFDPTSDHTLSGAAAADAGPVSIDVTSLVRSWVSGEDPNYGVALTQVGGNTAFATSESDLASERPKLEVCFRDDLAY